MTIWPPTQMRRRQHVQGQAERVQAGGEHGGPVAVRATCPASAGSRFSAKATGPSRASAEENTTPTASWLIFHPSDSGTSAARSITLLEYRTANGALAAIRSARARASASRELGRDDLVDQPECLGPPGVDGVAGHGQFECDGDRESFGQPQEAAGAGDQTPLRLGDAEHGVFRRHHQVAREHDLEPTGQGGAVDGGDDRLGEAPLREAAESTAGPHDVAALAGGKGLEIHAGAEGLVAAPGDDHHPAFVVVGQLVHGRRHGPAHGAVDGVARLGTVDGEDLDVPPALPQHFVSH